MAKAGLHFKVIAGYTVLISALLLSLWLVVDNMRSLLGVNQALTSQMARRNIADSLVYSLLEADNAERSIRNGVVADSERFDKAMGNAERAATRLKETTNDSTLTANIDSLLVLFNQKRDNVNRLAALMGNDGRGSYLKAKMNKLRQGIDSMVVHPETTVKSNNREIIYNVIKTRKGFFSRLADAFRRHHSDTIAIAHHSDVSIDTVNQSLDLADSVADVLAEIKRKEEQINRKWSRSIANNANDLQAISAQLAYKTELLLQAIRNGEQQSMKAVVECDMEARQAIVLKIIVLGIISISSAIVLISFINNDIRRWRNYNENLRRAKEETERIMEQRERLLLTITHDIKAPAASISGFTELIGEYIDNQRGRAYVENIRSSADHLHNLVSALLDYHQLENGKVKPNSVSFMPAKLIEDCVVERMQQAEAKGLQLGCHVENCGNKICSGDAFRIKQIIDNLVSNAIKYTANGSVDVNGKIEGQKLVIVVADTGCGMTDEESRIAFDAFTRLPSAQGIEGVGLGLSITRDLVNLLGGSISLATAVGRGSMFTVTLPVSLSVNSDDANAAERAKPAVSDSFRIIIVDDDKLQLTLLSEMSSRIKGAKLEVNIFLNVKDALWAISANNPSMVMVDVEMPEMNGKQFISHIDHSKMSVVAMTAHEPSIKPSLIEAGFDDCLFKPFSGNSLTDMLSRLLGVSLSYQGSSAFSSILAFADGDKEAEQAILSDLKKDLSESLEVLQSAHDDAEISRVAHKLLPIMSMLHSPIVSQLEKLSPENINQLSPAEIEQLTAEIVKELSSDIQHSLI